MTQAWPGTSYFLRELKLYLHLALCTNLEASWLNSPLCFLLMHWDEKCTTGKAALREGTSLCSYSKLYCWMQFICKCQSSITILWISFYHCVMRIQLLYFIGERMMPIHCMEHWSTVQKTSFPLPFSPVMKKWFRKLLSTCNRLV